MYVGGAVKSDTKDDPADYAHTEYYKDLETQRLRILVPKIL